MIKTFFNNLLFIGGYCVLLLTIYYLLSLLGIVNMYFDNDALLNRDAVWYLNLVDNGYLFVEGEQCNVAFFPFFSFIWRTFQLSPIGISILNVIVFIVGASTLTSVMTIEKKHLLLLISTPTLVFCFIPYSEAVFFYSVSLLLIGLKKENIWLILIGSLLAGSTRSVVIFFIPASFLLLLFSINADKKRIYSAATLIAGCLISFAIVMCLLRYETGVWNSFFEAQKAWGHGFKTPRLPFKSWRRETLWEDIYAISVATGIGLSVLYMISQRFKHQLFLNLSMDVLFSMFFISGVGLYVFLFQGGDFHSLNRYVFCTPFFWIVAINIRKLQLPIPWWTWLALVATLMFCFSDQSVFLININGHSIHKTILYTLVVSIMMLRWVYWVFKAEPSKVMYWIVFVIGISFQIHLLNTYLNGDWIG